MQLWLCVIVVGGGGDWWCDEIATYFFYQVCNTEFELNAFFYEIKKYVCRYLWTVPAQG